MTPEREQEVREIVARALEFRNRCVEAHKVRFMPERGDLSVAVVLEAMLPLLDAAEAEAARGREAIEACVGIRTICGPHRPSLANVWTRVWGAGDAELARREAAKPKPSTLVEVASALLKVLEECERGTLPASTPREHIEALRGALAREHAERLNAEVKP